ncbi:MAG: hypothetical protein GC158_03295 [Cyanobacteria bacterium RI_101]|nr:hypothetical protein [Cyanobacteria bacterium RI_101]
MEIYLPAPGENSFEKSDNFVFTDPQGKRLAQYPKSSTNPYFQLHLSPKNRRLAGDLDVGGEKPGEYFLKGRVGGTLELFKILAPGREVVVDRGREWEE